MAEILRWDSLSDVDRLAILRAAGFKRNLLKIVLLPWRKQSRGRRTRILNVDWRKAVAE